MQHWEKLYYSSDIVLQDTCCIGDLCILADSYRVCARVLQFCCLTTVSTCVQKIIDWYLVALLPASLVKLSMRSFTWTWLHTQCE